MDTYMAYAAATMATLCVILSLLVGFMLIRAIWRGL